MNSSFRMLNRNNIIYNYFLKKKVLEVKSKVSDHELLERIMSLAKFSWRNHSGFYYDGRMENILFDYGRNLSDYVDEKEAKKNIIKFLPDEKDYTVLHVATELYEVGGHTRVLYQFIKRHEVKNQILVLTGQNKKVPQWFADGIGANVTIITLNSIDSLFERSYVLRYISTLCKTIILYHHPHDVVPIMAFSHDKCPPVLLENHAHSWFWLGPTVADLVFAHTAFHKDLTLQTRPVDNVYYLQCIQIEDLPEKFKQKDKLAAKARLMLSPDTICLISIGTAEKFIPNAHYNFFKTAKKILKRFKNVELFIIGISESSHIRRKYHLDTHRIHFEGTVSDPSVYYMAADISLDALPQPSLGATLYSTLIGMSCPLFKYGSGNIFNTRKLAESELYDRYIGELESEEEFLDKLEFLINNPDIRNEIANEIRDKYIITHSNDAFLKNINKMFQLSKNIIHQPQKIPDGICYYDADSAEIADTSCFQDLAAVINYFDNYLSLRNKIAITARLLAKGICCTDILRLAGTFSKNRIKKLLDVLSGWIPEVLKPQGHQGGTPKA